MTDFNLAVADRKQLKHYADQELGLALSLSMTEDTMRKRIVAHCKEHNVEMPKSELVVPSGKKHKMITINIAKQDKPGGAEPAFVGYQGKGFTIPRGIDIAVPSPLVEILKNAVQDIVTQDPESGEIHKEPVLTYPFQQISAA